ncbi:multiheme c-type cytochrome [Teredinibacter purpureus]|uniref:multiheme c-type cytochrome n=1 Tax=Teredinibacter purpureus TaxID=2731756 RepID=UPI0005F8763B|nr:multiheme c-type cytochrome [Teredinibacter purpureus]
MKLFLSTFWILTTLLSSALAYSATAIENRTASTATSQPFPPHRATTTTGKEIDHKNFDDAQVCGSCHGEIYEEWQTSMMARAWEDPLYRALLNKASIATDGAVDNFCTGCHTPIGLLSGQINSDVNRQAPGTENELHLPGVDCEACHNMSAINGLENGAYVLNAQIGDRPLKLGSRSDAVSPYHDTEYSDLHTRSEFCGTCHNVSHPFNQVPIERTYDEWYESTYRTDGVECQDCHMKPVKGKAAIMGPEREDRASHHFASANTTIMQYFGDHKQADRARSLLATAAELELLEAPSNPIPGERTHFSLRVKNTGAGHKLPTGFPEGREVWLDITLTDASGKIVYSSGKITKGKTEPGTRNYKVHLGDDDGKEVDIEVWTVSRILSDNRLLPKGYADERYEFVVPEWASAPLTLDAKLRYWPFSQAIADHLLGEGEIEVQIETIAELTKEIALATVQSPPVAMRD